MCYKVSRFYSQKKRLAFIFVLPCEHSTGSFPASGAPSRIERQCGSDHWPVERKVKQESCCMITLSIFLPAFSRLSPMIGYQLSPSLTTICPFLLVCSSSGLSTVLKISSGVDLYTEIPGFTYFIFFIYLPTQTGSIV